MFSSAIRRRLFVLCSNGFYHKGTKFAPLAKIPSFGMTNTKTRMTAHFMTEATNAINEHEISELMNVWPALLHDLINTDHYLDLPDVSKWMVKSLQYNVLHGRKRRALTLIRTYQMLTPQEKLTNENIHLVRILGWCMELLQGFLLIIDDIQDKSQIRRNQPCWYLFDDIGLAAINDGFMIENTIYQILKLYFKEKEYYVDLVELFHDYILKTTIGQCLDLLSTNFGKTANLDVFTMDRYNSIIKNKTAYYAFVLPVKLAMCAANVKDPELHRQVEALLLEMGHFYQIQDDYLDCYGDTKIIGKNSTDIQEGKCTWLIVSALQRVTPEQRKILEECYGSEDLEKVRRVKNLYDDLDLPNAYSIFEKETYNLIMAHIKQLPNSLPQNFFSDILRKIYHRKN
uniref:farnesyl pyrophosphate synthase isoform X2 n=1 Tax=Vespula vulgaris TaxID=7454 RepID=UPI0021231DE7|nr:farnesyl pyrophosphate synthase isoform X2 [Vespula vulgaris]